MDGKRPAPADGEPTGRSTTRSAALTATLIAVPIALVAWIALFGLSGGFSGSSKTGSAHPSASASPKVAASGPVAVDLTAPTPAPRVDQNVVETYCRALLAKLPKRLGTNAGRPVIPASAVERAAAWGDPPIVLRCGVGAPATATGTLRVIEFQNVTWLVPDGAEDAQILRAVGRKVAVELDIPAAYAGHPATLLGPLSDAVTATIPLAG